MRKPDGLVRVVPVPGLHFEPRDVTPEEAAELVASRSFQYAEAPSGEAPTPAVTAATTEATDGNSAA